MTSSAKATLTMNTSYFPNNLGPLLQVTLRINLFYTIILTIPCDNMLLIIIFHIGLLTSLYYLVVLEHPHQYVQNFFHFAHLKPTFSILHVYFYKTPPSVCLLYTFIQIKYSFF